MAAKKAPMRKPVAKVAARKAPAKKMAAPKAAPKKTGSKTSGRKPSDFMGANISSSAAGKRMADEGMTAKSKAVKAAQRRGLSGVATAAAGNNAYYATVKKAKGYKVSDTDASYAARNKKK